MRSLTIAVTIEAVTGFQWFGAKLWYLHYWYTGDMTKLCQTIDVVEDYELVVDKNMTDWLGVDIANTIFCHNWLLMDGIW